MLGQYVKFTLNGIEYFGKITLYEGYIFPKDIQVISFWRENVLGCFDSEPYILDHIKLFDLTIDLYNVEFIDIDDMQYRLLTGFTL